MVARRRPFPFDVVVPVALGVAVFAFACGSSSVAEVQRAGKPARWAMLFLLLGLAVAWAARARRRFSVTPAVLVPTAALCALALVSALWSGDPRLTLGRGVSLVVLFTTAALLAHAATTQPEGTERILFGIVGGATAVALAGLAVLVLHHDTAMQAATRDLPARYRGFGENPDTAPLLLALCFPVLAWLLLRYRSWRPRLGIAALALLFDGSVIASASRGSLIAGFAGVLLLVAAAPARRAARVLAGVGVVGLLAASLAIALAPKSKGAEPIVAKPAHAQPAKKAPAPAHPRYSDVQGAFPLEFDIGTQLAGTGNPTPRSLFGLSGRGVAWRGAIDQGNERPLLGYGFGTEAHVFEDRYANFVSGLPENSYIGLYLQLGGIGAALFLLLAASLLAAAARAGDFRRTVAPAAAFAVALVLAMVQSYLYSAGNIAALALWTCGFLGAAVAGQRSAA